MSDRTSAPTMTSNELRQDWQYRAGAYGWGFPDDWHVPAVEAVCEAILADADVWAAAERLGESRAAAGVPLAEALADVDSLAAMVHPRYTDPLRRAVSLGWADRIIAPPSTVADPLTGLVTPEYLNLRLGEVYRAAEVTGEQLAAGWALVVVRLDLLGHSGWQRILPMILVADGLRRVFDGGESLALLADSVAVVLCRREPMLARRARLLCSMISDQIELDARLVIPAPSVWIETLPPGYAAARDLVADLSR